MESLDELRSNLVEYRTQLAQVEELLLNEPNNEEYADIYNSLTEVIELTENLVKEARSKELVQEHKEESQAEYSAPQSVQPRPRGNITTQAPSLQLPSILPPQVAQQIRSAQQKAALQGQAPAVWAIGARCQAVYSGDGEWYEATVKGVSDTGDFVVSFDAYEHEESVSQQHAKPRSDSEETYRGVSAPKRKRVEEVPTEIGEMPKWLEIKETDNEKTKQKKKKLQKSYKSKKRFHDMDVATKQRQSSWMNFQKGKGQKKKTGFLTGRKKGSIFSISDDPEAKVGVVGSGKGMTDYKGPGRHDFGGASDL